MVNSNVRTRAKESGVTFWQIADKMNVSESTITRMMRFPLSAEKENEVNEVIDAIASERADR